MVACGSLALLGEAGIVGLLAYPTSCDYYFYLKIFASLFIILSFLLKDSEEERNFRPGDMISSMGVSAIVVIIIALFGTFLEAPLLDGTIIKVVQPDIFITTLVAGLVIIVIWILKK